jgi:hypothetical protein
VHQVDDPIANGALGTAFSAVNLTVEDLLLVPSAGAQCEAVAR